jgi:hypothetical protein
MSSDRTKAHASRPTLLKFSRHLPGWLAMATVLGVASLSLPAQASTPPVSIPLIT